MKTISKILTVAALFAVVTIASADTATNAAPVAQLTAANVTDINNLLPMLPAAWQGVIIKVLAIVGTLGIVGRAFIGFKNGGLFGLIAGLLGGTNTPKNNPQAVAVSDGARGGAAGLRLLLCLALPALLLTGCGSIPHQLADNESGTGLKAKIPVGYNGNNIFELDLTVGTFKHTSIIQPVETNRVYTPSLVVAASTRGTFQGGTALSGAMLSTNSNPLAMVKGGDSYIFTTGHAESTITNNADETAQSWQDAPPSASQSVTNK